MTQETLPLEDEEVSDEELADNQPPADPQVEGTEGEPT